MEKNNDAAKTPKESGSLSLHHALSLFPEKKQQHKLPALDFLGIPGIEYLGKQRLAAVFYGGGDGEKPGNYILWRESNDGGQSWSEAIPAAIPLDPDGQRLFDPCLWMAPDQRLWLFFASAYGLVENCAVMAASAAPPYKSWHLHKNIAPGVMMNKPIVLADGSWALPVSRWASMSLQENLPVGSSIFISKDNGESFEYRGTAETPPCSCNENQLLQKNDKSLWMLSRNQPQLAENFSFDLGSSWTEPAYSALHGVDARFALRRLASGRVLLVNHGPVPEGEARRANMTCALSEDDAQTWKWSLLIDPRAEISYPDFCQDEEGYIHLIYDRDRYGDKKLVLCKFSEADIMAGKQPELLEI